MKTHINYFDKNICILLKNGLKHKSQHSMCRLLKQFKDLKQVSWEKRGIDIIIETTTSIIPLIKIEGRKVSGKVYGVPVYLDAKPATWMGMRWIYETVRDSGKIKLETKLLQEILEIQNGKGKTLKRQEALYQEALKKRAHLIYL